MRRLPRWKREQTVRKRQRFARAIYIFISIAVAGLFFLGGSFFFLATYLSGFQAFDRFNLVLVGRDFTVISASTAEKKVTVAVIPSDTLVSFPSFYARYRVGAIPQLDEIEKKNGRLILDGVRLFLGVPVEKWLTVRGGKASLSSPDDVKRFFSYDSLFGDIKGFFSLFQSGNLSYIEFLQLWYFMASLRPDRIEFLSLANSPLLREVTLADESRALEIDMVALDHFLGQSFVEKHMISERYMIEVQNGTGVSGQAAIAKRLLTNIGGDVISMTKIDNLQMETKVCVKVADLLKTYTVRRIAKLFLAEESLCSEQGGRADVIVILGKDYFFRWN